MQSARSSWPPAQLFRWLARWLVALALLLPATLPAAATGTLFCTIDDRNLSFELLGTTRIDYGTVVQVQHGNLTLKPGRYAKRAMQFAITQDDIFLQWSFDRDLRFAIHLDDPDNGRSIILAIIAERNEKLEKYLGRYVLQFVGAKPTEVVKGRIKSCDGD